MVILFDQRCRIIRPTRADMNPQAPFLAAFVCLVSLPISSGAEDEAGIAFFESKIRPVLVSHCYECHSVESGKARGGLKVDSRDALLKGGNSGPAVAPGKPDESLLMVALHFDDPDFEMPPDGKLPESIISDFARWIAMGAPDPRRGAAPVTVTTQIDVEAGRKFWSYQPVERPELPVVKNGAWPRTEIDRFVLAAMEDHGLAPSEDAEPSTLVRRLFFVLTGLPPSAEETVTWTRAIGRGLDQAALALLVDRLLASPHFGERWGRHWLDVARFAESTGGDSNNVFPHAWRYRDYVIGAFNEDKPFDRFIREQIAGDLLPTSSDLEWAENLVATGFLALGQKLVGEEDAETFFAELVDEQIDATTRAFLATTVACARCHDHKSDPIPQADYYALAAIFRNTTTHFGLFDEQARQHSALIDATPLGLPPGRPPLSMAELEGLVAERDAAVNQMEEIVKSIRSGNEKITRANLRRSRTQRGRAESALASYDDQGNPLALVMGAQDRAAPIETRLLVRGELDKPGQVVAPGLPQVLCAPGNPLLPPDLVGSGRRQLADWIASPDNPLTARVVANRLWHWTFGRGLVSSPDDFGSTGEGPSHPELLDFMARRVVENGWSVKRTIREMVLSRAWQQSSAFHPSHFEIDPDNRHLWRAHPRRLEAEAVRDAMLAVSGGLQLGRPPLPLLDPVGEGTVGQSVFEPEIRKIEGPWRSVYLPRVRAVLPESLELFDAPDASTVTGAREVTTVPLQALFILNSPFSLAQAKAFAARVAARPVDQQIDFAYLTAYARFPTSRERELASVAVRRIRMDDDASGPEAQQRAMAAWAQALMATAEFSLIE